MLKGAERIDVIDALFSLFAKKSGAVYSRMGRHVSQGCTSLCGR